MNAPLERATSTIIPQAIDLLEMVLDAGGFVNAAMLKDINTIVTRARKEEARPVSSSQERNRHHDDQASM